MDVVKSKQYAWKGIDSEGHKVEGIVLSENLTGAKENLGTQNITVLEIKEKTNFFTLKRRSKVRTIDIVIFMRQLATMVDAGIPLVHGIDIVSSGTDNLAMRNLLSAIYKDVSTGDSFAKALGKHPKYFNNLVVSLIAAGETSGALDDILKQIADYLERIETLHNRIKKAMFYPIVVLSVAIIISTILLVYIVPQFQHLFNSVGKKLPLPTRMVVSVSDFVRSFWWAILLFGVALVLSYILLYRRFEGFRIAIDKFKLNVFVFGPLIQKAVIARTMRTLALSVGAGVPLVKALDSVATVSGNLIYEAALKDVRNKVTTGKGFTYSLKQTELFPSMVLQMIAAGERSGALETMLDKVSDFYDEEVNSTVNAISTLIEPMMIIVLGAIIGFFVVSMYLPVFRLGTTI